MLGFYFRETNNLLNTREGLALSFLCNTFASSLLDKECGDAPFFKLLNCNLRGFYWLDFCPRRWSLARRATWRRAPLKKAACPKKVPQRGNLHQRARPSRIPLRRKFCRRGRRGVRGAQRSLTSVPLRMKPPWPVRRLQRGQERLEGTCPRQRHIQKWSWI